MRESETRERDVGKGGGLRRAGKGWKTLQGGERWEMRVAILEVSGKCRTFKYRCPFARTSTLDSRQRGVVDELMRNR